MSVFRASATDEAPWEDTTTHDWLQQRLDADEQPKTFDEGFAAGRIWLGFMTMRVMVALMLTLLQLLAVSFNAQSPIWLLLVAFSYLALTIATRLWVAPVRLGQQFESHWPYTSGLDLVFYFVFSWYSASGILSFWPLLAMPPLVCAALGTWRITVITVLLSLSLWAAHNWNSVAYPGLQQYLVYAQLGAFGIAMLVLTYTLHRMANGFGIQQTEMLGTRRIARMQRRINDLVVQSVSDGLMVVGRRGRIRAINGAAHAMLQLPQAREKLLGMRLQDLPSLRPLYHLAQQTFADGEGTSSEVLLFTDTAAQAPHMQVRTRFAQGDGDLLTGNENLCLLYLQDMQQLQQQMRTEKLAVMGRMSAAVAHEIRNPLAAIAQATQLLDEELDQPSQKKLSRMVQSNVQRLERIVTDVLDIASLQRLPRNTAPLLLDAFVARAVADWRHANGDDAHRVQLCLRAGTAHVRFEVEHLRRVLINLLDNARHYGVPDATGRATPIMVATQATVVQAHLHVWSHGPALPSALQGHLFEPFASGHSRRTGLGLYICRELAQRYHADMAYAREPASALCSEAAAGAAIDTTAQDAAPKGNVFSLVMPVCSVPPEVADAADMTEAPPAPPL